jgi:hypothetical protein
MVQDMNPSMLCCTKTWATKTSHTVMDTAMANHMNWELQLQHPLYDTAMYPKLMANLLENKRPLRGQDSWWHPETVLCFYLPTKMPIILLTMDVQNIRPAKYWADENGSQCSGIGKEWIMCTLLRDTKLYM